MHPGEGATQLSWRRVFWCLTWLFAASWRTAAGGGCDVTHAHAPPKVLFTEMFIPFDPASAASGFLGQPAGARAQLSLVALRAREQVEVLQYHASAGLFRSMVVFVEDDLQKSRVGAALDAVGVGVCGYELRLLPSGERLQYRHVFGACYALPTPSVCVYSHGDVFVESDGLARLRSLDAGTVLALARIETWDRCHLPMPRPLRSSSHARTGIAQDGWRHPGTDDDCRHMMSVGSFDTVILNSSVPDWMSSRAAGPSLQDFLATLDFRVGTLGVENMLVYALGRAAFAVLSPCNDIRAYHRHCSFVRQRERDSAMDPARAVREVRLTYLEHANDSQHVRMWQRGRDGWGSLRRRRKPESL